MKDRGGRAHPRPPRHRGCRQMELIWWNPAGPAPVEENCLDRRPFHREAPSALRDGRAGPRHSQDSRAGRVDPARRSLDRHGRADDRRGPEGPGVRRRARANQGRSRLHRAAGGALFRKRRALSARPLHQRTGGYARCHRRHLRHGADDAGHRALRSGRSRSTCSRRSSASPRPGRRFIPTRWRSASSTLASTERRARSARLAKGSTRSRAPSSRPRAIRVDATRSIPIRSTRLGARTRRSRTCAKAWSRSSVYCSS